MQTTLQYLLPHKILSKIAWLCAECKIVWVKNYLINYFIKRYPVKMHEAIQENPFDYPSYNAFFTRSLKPECRPIDIAEKSLVSPADGSVSQIGAIKQGSIMQAKGHEYSVSSLLGAQDDLTDLFIDGYFATIYLAPKDYHRVHMPIAGTLKKMLYVPGKLFSVNNHAAENIPNLFARNERVVTIFDTSIGPVSVILVGAMIVGSIETVWEGMITPPHLKTLSLFDYQKKNISLAKGQELGRFNLGSTVIILLPKGVVNWQTQLVSGTEVRMGQKIGELL